MNQPYLWALALLAALTGAGAWLAWEMRRVGLYRFRVAMVQGSANSRTSREAGEPAPFAAAKLASWLGSAVLRSGLLSSSTQRVLRHTLQAAGVRGDGGMPLFVGAKVIGLLALPVLAMLFSQGAGLGLTMRSVLLAGSGIVGLMAPEWVLRSISKRHAKRVEQGVPDALDMLLICSDAGYGLEPSLIRVKDEIRFAHPSVALEFELTVTELRMMADMRSALANLGARTGVNGLKRLGATLTQAAQYGTPLGTALRELASDLRREATTRYEERAARLPATLTVPLILFIMPCVLLVVVGPAIVMALKQMG